MKRFGLSLAFVMGFDTATQKWPIVNLILNFAGPSNNIKTRSFTHHPNEHRFEKTIIYDLL